MDSTSFGKVTSSKNKGGDLFFTINNKLFWVKIK